MLNVREAPKDRFLVIVGREEARGEMFAERAYRVVFCTRMLQFAGFVTVGSKVKVSAMTHPNKLTTSGDVP